MSERRYSMQVELDSERQLLEFLEVSRQLGLPIPKITRLPEDAEDGADAERIRAALQARGTQLDTESTGSGSELKPF